MIIIFIFLKGIVCMVNQTALLSTNPSTLHSNNNRNTIYLNDSKIDECSAINLIHKKQIVNKFF